MRLFEVLRIAVCFQRVWGEGGEKFLTGNPFFSEEPLCKILETYFSARVKVETEIQQMLLIDKMKI